MGSVMLSCYASALECLKQLGKLCVQRVQSYELYNNTVLVGRKVDWEGGVFQNRGLRRIAGPRRDEVTGEWRKLQKEEL
jgi:hypothetical protein